MKPYYEEKGIAIYHGDCREILPELRHACVTITSPPYNTLPLAHNPSGLHAQRKSGVNQWIARAVDGYSDALPEVEYQKWLCGIIGQCLEVTEGLVWVNHKVRYRDGEVVHPVRFLPFPLYSEVIWDRAGSMALNCKRFSPSHEGIWGFGRPHFWNDELNKLLSVWRLGFDRDPNEHPCAFPLEIALRLITSSSRPNEMVLDPFCGSGTTLRAAKDLGRRAIGIEIEERYCEIAANRLRQSVMDFSGRVV